MKKDRNTLSKDEIIRGYNSFQNIIKSATIFDTKFFKVFLTIEKDLSPHNVNKVGFIISKKRFSKAVLRNKLKRFLREIYRINKNLISENSLNIILSLNQNSVKYKKDLISNGYSILTDDFFKVAEKINNFSQKQR